MLKTLVTAIVLAAASVTFVANSYAGPTGPSDAEKAWMDRASAPYQGENGGQ
jgi:hypothetical protein